MAAVPMTSAADDWLLSMFYDATGLAYVIVYDNGLLGWWVDPAAAPLPIILGTLPPTPPATAPVFSPTWAHIEPGGGVKVPDTIRMSATDFLTWLATNGGANRKVQCRFSNVTFDAYWKNWSRANPTRVYTGP
jgi:hypothetical protein